MKIENPKPKNQEFSHYWNLMVEDVKVRRNVSPSHLLQLAVLCDAYCQYDQLLEIVKEEGYTILKVTERGESVSANPNAAALSRVIAQIKDYSKILGLLLVKDEGIGSTEQDEDDWT